MNNTFFTWLVKLIREDKLVKFYQHRSWRDLRQEALQRDNRECQPCKRQGKYSGAENVHHLKEVKQFPHLALDINNIESICIPCHNKEHKRFGRFEKNYNKKNNFTNFVDKECW